MQTTNPQKLLKQAEEALARMAKLEKEIKLLQVRVGNLEAQVSSLKR